MIHPVLQNSYVILILAFLGLSIIFYLGGIGFVTQLKNGKPTKTFTWKYQLGIALIIWVVWNFYLYPPDEAQTIKKVKPNVRNYPSNDIRSLKMKIEDWN